jgi:hypothetical protein
LVVLGLPQLQGTVLTKRSDQIPMGMVSQANNFLVMRLKKEDDKYID